MITVLRTTGPPLVAEPLSSALVHGGLLTDVRVVAETGSTNTDLLAGGGAPDGSVLVAEVQTAGRGRQGRTWTAPAGSGLTFSVLVRPGGVEAGRWSWLPLLAGMAMASAITRICVLGVRLKWPNDLLVCPSGEDGPPPRKVGGILAERSGGAVAIGVGLNVSGSVADLPAGGISLDAAGVRWATRQEMLVTALREFERWYAAWQRAGGDPDACGARPMYRHLSETLGRSVHVELPGGEEVYGTAQDVDQHGRLVVASDSGEQAVSAGDVVHVR